MRRFLTCIFLFALLGQYQAFWYLDEPRIDESPTNGWFAVAELGLAPVGNEFKPHRVWNSRDLGLIAGYSFERVAPVLQFELNGWNNLVNDEEIHEKALNIGTGIHIYLFQKRVRMSISGGLAIMLSNNALDDAGKTGFYVDLRPGALTWPIDRHISFNFDFLTLNFVAPVLDGIPLLIIEYRTVLSLQYDL